MNNDTNSKSYQYPDRIIPVKDGIFKQKEIAKRNKRSDQQRKWRKEQDQEDDQADYG